MPNRALQSLTRELNAAVAIDDTTLRRAGSICAGFESHADLIIRGRVQLETVHALPPATSPFGFRGGPR